MLEVSKLSIQQTGLASYETLAEARQAQKQAPALVMSGAPLYVAMHSSLVAMSLVTFSNTFFLGLSMPSGAPSTSSRPCALIRSPTCAPATRSAQTVR
jgi:hypothetical protein